MSIVWFVLLTLIHWIAIYPVDSVIQPLNNWDQMTVVSSLVKEPRLKIAFFFFGVA